VTGERAVHASWRGRWWKIAGGGGSEGLEEVADQPVGAFWRVGGGGGDDAGVGHQDQWDSTRGSVSGSGKGAKALAYAQAQLGEPYARSGAGPSSWDCSGLTMKAWGSVGVSLPHSSRQQFNLGRPVAKSDLQLGDLVFFYSDIHHVALYAGRGQVIHAPRPGKSVEYIKMSYMPYAGARRPG
jgi:hypothetical protein